MTDANPAFDTVHPSGHILVRSCRGGYMHSVALSEEAMETDAETLARGIVLTADVSCLKALLEVRDEIVAAGHTPWRRSRPRRTSMRRSKSCWRTNCAAARIRQEGRPATAARSWPRRDRARYRSAARRGWGRTTLVRGASRARTSSSCCCSAESAMAPRYPGRRSCTIHDWIEHQGVPVVLAGGDLRSDNGAPAPPESYPGIAGRACLQLSH